jgi:predicted nucleotide-binding protein (sugar kinase/HSP70/actin superfamily)
MGGALHKWRQGAIDGVVSVGPLECMPNKIAEAQLSPVAEQEGLPSLTLFVNGDPVDAASTDRFVCEVRTRFGHREHRRASARRWAAC